MNLTNLSVDQQRELIDRILHLSPVTYLFGGITSNQEIVRAAYTGDYQNFRLLSQEAIGAARRSELVRNPNYSQIWDSVFADPNFARKAGSVANEQMILAEVIGRGIYPADNPLDEANLSQVVVDVWDSLADSNREAVAVSDAAKRRLRQIHDMTQRNTKGFTVQIANRKVAYNSDGTLYDAMAGQARGLSMGLSGPWSRGAGSKSFEQMSNDEIQELYDAWKFTNDLRAMTPDQLRAIVKNNGKTDLWGKNVHALDSTPNPTDGLCHPTTGEPFTQKSLIRYINNPNDPYCGRRLITHPSSGKVIPRLKELFEKTIRGEFEERL